MLWPIILPFQITIGMLFVFTVLATALAPAIRWKRISAFQVSLLISVLAFIPSCAGLMNIIDRYRFGVFDYSSFDDVQDFRCERYLPHAAKNIRMEKFANGYRARYSISSDALHAYIDSLWREYGKQSATKRSSFHDEGQPADKETQALHFKGLNWPPLKNAVILHSPNELDGGGATYFFDSQSETVYQRTGYW